MQIPTRDNCQGLDWVILEEQGNDDSERGHLKSEVLAHMGKIISYIFCCLVIIYLAEQEKTSYYSFCVGAVETQT